MKKLLLILLLITVSAWAEEQVFVQVRFREKTEYGFYNDALYFSQKEYSTTKAEDITAKKKSRVDNWINIIRNPPKAIEPTAQEIQLEIDDIEMQKQNLNFRKIELQNKKLELLNTETTKVIQLNFELIK